MKVLLLITWENPKSDEDLKKYYDNLQEFSDYRSEKFEEYNANSSSWADGTGKMYVLTEFESFEDYAKYMEDVELQKNWINFSRLVNNVEMKVLREGLMVPP